MWFLYLFPGSLRMVRGGFTDFILQDISELVSVIMESITVYDGVSGVPFFRFFQFWSGFCKIVFEIFRWGQWNFLAIMDRRYILARHSRFFPIFDFSPRKIPNLRTIFTTNEFFLSKPWVEAIVISIRDRFDFLCYFQVLRLTGPNWPLLCMIFR